MKKIVKQPQPVELQQWRATNANVPENLKYGCGGFPTEAVLNALLTEQGFLCAYTLLKISDVKAHIEHLKPQALCRDEDRAREQNGSQCQYEDVSWFNMVACYPQPNAPHPGFGAVQKDKWWEGAKFISPLAENCESRFRFKNDGSIEAAMKGDSATLKTIDELRLDCKKLCEARKNAIMKAGLHKRALKPLKSEKKVRAFVQNLSKRQGNDFIEFCTVLEHAASDYIQELQKRAKRKRYALTRGGR